MATPIQQLKGTAAEVAAKIYAQGLLVWNETAKRWHGGDGSTAGGIAMARYDERNDGSLGYQQDIKTADYTVLLADSGKMLVGNKATAINFPLSTAATLGAKFVAGFKNINAGAMTVTPNGAELIDGVNAAITIPTGASVVIKGDGSSFRTYFSNGDVTGNAINNAAALTGANLADNDKLGVYDVSASSLVSILVSELIAGIFKTARKIANAYFLSSFRLWDATDNTKGLAFNLASIATATTRTITMPNADVDLSNVAPADVKAWVNFNGTGAVAIRASKNVSSITDNGTGDYTVNFTTALADANYSAVATGSNANHASGSRTVTIQDGYTASALRLLTSYPGAPTAGVDLLTVNVQVVR